MRQLAPFSTLIFLGLVAFASPGCSGDANTTSTSTAGDSSSSGSGAGGNGGNGGSGGAGGEGGGTASHTGKSAVDFVSGGDVSKSANYKMVHTLGQPTQNQGKSNSSNYRLQGGLSGANGSLP
jgi:hypothetical protein